MGASITALSIAQSAINVREQRAQLSSAQSVNSDMAENMADQTVACMTDNTQGNKGQYEGTSTWDGLK